ncbi:N-acetyltransferase [Mycolicibacterium fluoranthenivorans]|uniref:N-acetyltransferase n=1 Tax=Mycolicibacterium fluoranthenivorans TaxID=258505 RepID=A0A7G8P7A8_9MYCO|nr:GNAT family N-acetyltransferase [Mycolicibacterium fluoranthenivorans]QNJ90224.1 N-acetyltransferase [Mycolicibacterium fluoranthenivorans]
MSVRTATADDLPAIADIYAHYVATSVATFELDAPDLAEWADRFSAIVEAGLPFVVGERDGAVAAYAYCAPWKIRPAYRATVEDSVYVAPWAIGTGCGTELLAELLHRCRGAGVREVIAVIADSGDPASLGLHRRFGFRDAGRLVRVGYKHERWIDTVLLQWSAG